MNILAENPALARADWLPDDIWPDLDALRATHVRLLAARAEAGEAVAAVRRTHEAEDRERAAALERAYREGTDPADVPAVTPPDERRAQIAAAEEHIKAANKALEAFLAEAVETIQRHEAEWLQDLADREAEVEAKREEAARLLAEADAAVEWVPRMRMWLRRTAGSDPRWQSSAFADPAPLPFRHIGADVIVNPQPVPSLVELANRGVRPNELDRSAPLPEGHHYLTGSEAEGYVGTAGDDTDRNGVTGYNHG